jgi:hypothetical protein
MEGHGGAAGAAETDGESILGCEAFLGLLRRERACADRNQHSFVVLAYSVEQRAATAAFRAVISRVRATDVVGWLPGGRLGVLLRYATLSGAVGVAAAIGRRAWPAGAPECTAYAYPPPASGRKPPKPESVPAPLPAALPAPRPEPVSELVHFESADPRRDGAPLLQVRP